MNGAESQVRTAAQAGVTVWFANPGTTELPLVSALDAVPGVRAVLCLFEGVCSAAADGFGRMAERPAATLLHLGPGFANGIANFHNARRARTPILNVIGDHASWHRDADPPLASDVASLAGPVSGWLREVASAGEIARDTAEAIAAARRGCVATLVVPHDLQGAAAPGPAPAAGPPSAPAPSPERVTRTAKLLSDASAGPFALHLGGAGLLARGLAAAGRIVAATGCRLFCDTFPARVERGPDLPPVDRLPYFPEQALASLRPFRSVVFAGARPPVSFFGYPGVPSVLVADDQQTASLAGPEEDVASALEALADELSAGSAPRARGGAAPPAPPHRTSGAASRLSPENVAAVVASLQPEGAIVMDEGLTAGLPYYAAAAGAPSHSYLGLTGGAIGQGLPAATGAALARPDRAVIALQADGSGMYTLQSLWTQAREGLHVVNLVLANRGYRILAIEQERAGTAPGAFASALADFSPDPDWVALARGFGVPAERVTDTTDFARALERALAKPGPHLIEIPVFL